MYIHGKALDALNPPSAEAEALLSKAVRRCSCVYASQPTTLILACAGETRPHKRGRVERTRALLLEARRFAAGRQLLQRKQSGRSVAQSPTQLVDAQATNDDKHDE